MLQKELIIIARTRTYKLEGVVIKENAFTPTAILPSHLHLQQAKYESNATILLSEQEFEKVVSIKNVVLQIFAKKHTFAQIWQNLNITSLKRI